MRAVTVAALMLPLLIAGCALHTRTTPSKQQDLAPDFNLTDHTGKTWHLAEVLKDGPAVVIFYRGYW